jgi:4'-phosphopantetheinyl transferase EntD
VSNNTQSHGVDGSREPNPAQPSTLVESLFPPGVAAAELRTPGDLALVDPEEAQIVARAVPKRLGEFAAGRLCARSALKRFGIASFPVLAAHDRQPLWPAGLVGSITHTQGFCAAVIGELTRFAGLGLDTEKADAVSPKLCPSICVAEELAWIESLPAEERIRAATLVFAAKEAFYKCQYPSTAEWLNFSDLCIVPLEGSLRQGSFRVDARRALRVFASLPSGSPQLLQTAYRFHDEFVSVGVALVRESASETSSKASASTPCRRGTA